MKRKTKGMRERQAGKRHRRALYWHSMMGSVVEPLKVGRKHILRCMNGYHNKAVAESEKRANGAPEFD
jgi:hypothetical protein